MLKNYIFVVCTAIALLCIPAQNANAQSKQELLQKYPGIAADLNNSFEGRQFIFAMPPNEATSVNIAQRALEIFIISRFDTEVTLSMPGFGFGPITKQVRAGEITTFSSEANELSWAMEVRASEEVTDKGIFVSSADPIKVWVLSAKRFCSEGYAVRPLHMWGREHRHLAYYDYPETQTTRGGGFIVVAQEDDTKVEVELDGSSAGGTTVQGRKPGDRFEITLNRGQTYMIRGTGIDRAFDISGSLISSSNPVGVIAFHERTIIPTAMGSSSRDNLMEMLPSTETWGLEHVSLEFERENTGDYFRIMALEGQTEYSIRSYATDNDRELISVRTGTLENPGDWAEFEEVNPQGGAVSIRGTSVWTSTKPTMVMQYSYSSGWDSNQDFDPFMMLLPPLDQYMLGANSISTPSSAEFNLNWLNIFVQAPEEADPEQKLLRQVELDGTAISVRDPLFLIQQIPGTNIHWARINVPPAAHIVTSPLPFTTHTYGFSRFESYGWTDGLSGDFVNNGDNTPPKIESESSSASVIELEIGDASDEGVGLAAVELVRAESSNARLTYLDDLNNGTQPKSARVQITQVDPGQSARAVVLARDLAGNLNVEEFTIDVPEMRVEPAVLDFGLQRVGEPSELTVTLTNGGSSSITLVSQEIIAPNSSFEFLESSLPIVLNAGMSATMTVRYTPLTETARNNIDDDAAVGTLTSQEGFSAEFTMRGTGGIPRLQATTESFGLTAVGESTCVSRAINFRNGGTYPLTVTALDALEAPFAWQDNPIELPLTLAPSAEFVSGTICFTPTAVGTFDQVVGITVDPEDPTVVGLILRGTAGEPVSVQESGSPDPGRIISLSPNPANTKVQLNWSLATNTPLNLHVIDLRGLTVLSQNLGMRAAGTNSIELDVRTLPVGNYFVLLQGERVYSAHALQISR